MHIIEAQGRRAASPARSIAKTSPRSASFPTVAATAAYRISKRWAITARGAVVHPRRRRLRRHAVGLSRRHPVSAGARTWRWVSATPSSIRTDRSSTTPNEPLLLQHGHERPGAVLPRQLLSRQVRQLIATTWASLAEETHHAFDRGGVAQRAAVTEALACATAWRAESRPRARLPARTARRCLPRRAR